jgi:hypothetical protein
VTLFSGAKLVLHRDILYFSSGLYGFILLSDVSTQFCS